MGGFICIKTLYVLYYRNLSVIGWYSYLNYLILLQVHNTYFESHNRYSGLRQIKQQYNRHFGLPEEAKAGVARALIVKNFEA